MIREILEQNGYKFKETTFSHYWPRGEVYEFVEIDILKNGHEFCVCYEDNENAIEQACRQYVKENGFKLEWLPEDAKYYSWSDLKGLCNIYFDTMYTWDCEDDRKLIAWLYANDIKVVE